MGSRTPSSPIALVGLSGSGKSTVAPLVAARLKASLVDLDLEVERASGLSVQALFARDGEAAFRRLERLALERAVDAGAGVIACGGGVIETEAARALLRDRCRTVWLEVEPEAAAARVRDTAQHRPLLGAGAPPERLAALLARRAGGYAEVARVHVRTDGLSAEAVAERVLRALGSVIPAGDKG